MGLDKPVIAKSFLAWRNDAQVYEVMYIHVHICTGEVYTFGKYGEGQLGRSGEGDAGDSEAWHLSPGPIPSLSDGCEVVWVGAGSNQTFVAVNESLVSDQNLGKCHVFADSQSIGRYTL